MPGGHQVTRFDDAGILHDGDLPADTRLTCIVLSKEPGPEGPVLQLLGLLEGVDDLGVGRFLLRWNLRQGAPATVLGGPFAVRLPLVLARVGNAEAAGLLGGLDMAAGLVLQGTALEAWQPASVPGVPREAAPVGATPRTASASRADLECWEALRLAADVGGMPAPAVRPDRPAHGAPHGASHGPR